MKEECFMDSVYNSMEEIRNWPEHKKVFGALNNDNSFTPIIVEKYHPQSIAFEHQSLYEKQEAKQSWLTRKDLELVLQTMPKPRIDFDDVISELKKYNYLSEDKLENGELRYFIQSKEWY